MTTAATKALTSLSYRPIRLVNRDQPSEPRFDTEEMVDTLGQAPSASTMRDSSVTQANGDSEIKQAVR